MSKKKTYWLTLTYDVTVRVEATSKVAARQLAEETVDVKPKMIQPQKGVLVTGVSHQETIVEVTE